MGDISMRKVLFVLLGLFMVAGCAAANPPAPVRLAAAAATYTQVALSATVNGTSVTATTTVKASSQTVASSYGVCVRNASDGNVDFSKQANVTITTTGTRFTSTAKTFPAGTYSYFPCLQVSGVWFEPGVRKSFTVGGPPTTTVPPTTTTPPVTTTPPATTVPSTTTVPPTTSVPTTNSAPVTTTAPVTTSTAPPGAPQPVGVPGAWVLRFQDEFPGTAIDTTRWNTNESKSQNGVTNHAANVAVVGGNAVMTLASASSGAMLSTGKVDGVGVDRYTLPVGGYAEARVFFPGTGTTVNNWPAWWAVGNGWPGNGENDIAEGLGHMTVNYHSTSQNFGFTIPGTWAGAFHVYGLARTPGHTDIYYDGALVKSWATADPGVPQALVLNLGNGFGPQVFGTASQLKVDYVRAWTN